MTILHFDFKILHRRKIKYNANFNAGNSVTNRITFPYTMEGIDALKNEIEIFFKH